MYVNGRNFRPGERVEISVVPNRRQWHVGDAINDVTGVSGAAAPNVVRADAKGRFTAKVWDRQLQRRGAYDIVARRLDLGELEQGQPKIRAVDVVSYARETAYILFLYYPPGGSLMDIAGRPLQRFPYFQFADSFADTNDDVWGAVDTTYVPVGHTGGTYAAYYVVNHRTTTQWAADNSLSDVSGGRDRAGESRMRERHRRHHLACTSDGRQLRCRGEFRHASSITWATCTSSMRWRAEALLLSIDAYDLTRPVPQWIPERGDLILKRPEFWSHLNDAATYPTYTDPFGGLFAGHVYLSKISVSGHSRGGEASVSSWVRYQLRPPAQQFSIGSVSSIAAVDGQGYVLGDVPYFVILPASDCDVFGLSGARIYDRAGTVSNLTVKSGVDVYGANHDFFNTVWAADGDDCDGPGRNDYIPAADQQKIGEAYLSAFVRSQLLGDFCVPIIGNLMGRPQA